MNPHSTRPARSRQWAGLALAAVLSIGLLGGMVVGPHSEGLAQVVLTSTPTVTPTATETLSITLTPSITPTPTITQTPGNTFTPTITRTPTVTQVAVGAELNFTLILVSNQVNVTVRNLGTGSSVPTSIQFTLAPDTTLLSPRSPPDDCTFQDPVLTCPVPALSPMGLFTLSVPLNRIGSVVFTSVVLDSEHRNQERDETNNEVINVQVSSLRAPSGISSGAPDLGQSGPISFPGGISTSGGGEEGPRPASERPTEPGGPTVPPTAAPPLSPPATPPAGPSAPLPGLPAGQTPADCTDYLVVFAPYPVYGATDTPPLTEPVWLAQPGEWYLVQLVEVGYALAVLESDAQAAGGDSPVWFAIQGDPVGIEGHRICP